MEQASLERAWRRLEKARGGDVDGAPLAAALERARVALEDLAERAAELEAVVPERVAGAIQEGMRAEALPVARHVAELRGLSAQTIRRLERLQGDVDAERRARVEDLGLLVDLVASGWRSLERRVDRLDRTVDRLEQSLADGPIAELYRLEERQERQPGA